MVQSSWPSPAHNTRNVTDPEYEKIAARFSDDGVFGVPSDTSVIYTTTGLQVFVRADKYASVRGHAWSAGTVDDTLTITSNASGQTRIDRVVLRLDRSTWTVRAVVVAGTPGSGAPALTQDTGDTGVFEVQLARVTVPNGAASVTVTREELYVGSRVRVCKSTDPNLFPQLGEIQYETDTGRWVAWNGTSRVVIYEDTGKLTLGSGFSTWESFSSNYGRKHNGLVSLRVSVRRIGSTLLASDPDGSKIGSVPDTLKPIEHYQHFSGRLTSSGGVVRVEVRPDGEIWVRYPTENVTVGRVLELTMTYLP